MIKMRKFSLEVAPSSRTLCNTSKCPNHIKRGEIRLVKTTPGTRFNNKIYYCRTCAINILNREIKEIENMIELLFEPNEELIKMHNSPITNLQLLTIKKEEGVLL